MKDFEKHCTKTHSNQKVQAKNATVCRARSKNESFHNRRSMKASRQTFPIQTNKNMNKKIN